MKRWAIVGGALVLALWLPFLCTQFGSAPAVERPRSPVDVAPSEPALAGSSAESVRAKVPVEPTPHVALGPGATSAPTPDAPQPLLHAKSPTLPKQTKSEPPSATGQVDVLRRAYETQPRDASWASEAETKLRAVFGTEEIPADMLRSIACRSAVCRLQLVWTAARTPSFILLNQRFGDDFSADIATEPKAPNSGEEAWEVDMYLIRQGVTVSDLSK